MDIEKASRKLQKELNAGAISIVLLGLLRERGQPMYGYEIAKLLESRAGGTLPMNQGALYPVLRSLDKQGFLTSEVEPSVSGPPRRYYRITKDGRQALIAWTETWERTKHFVDSVVASSHESDAGSTRPTVPRSTRA